MLPSWLAICSLLVQPQLQTLAFEQKKVYEKRTPFSPPPLYPRASSQERRKRGGYHTPIFFQNANAFRFGYTKPEQITSHDGNLDPLYKLI